MTKKLTPTRTVSAMDRLNEKQRLFVREYIKDMDAGKAAKRAGYSEKTAYSIGQRLTKNPIVIEAIAELMEERNQRLRVDSDWLLKRLVQEAQADIADLFNDDGSLLPAHDWPEIWRKGLVAGIDIDEIRSPSGTLIGHTKKLKLADRTKRLEMIGRHVDVQAFRDRVQHDVAPDLTAAIERGTQRVLEAAAKKALK